MEGIFIIVVVATVALLLLVIYDKRNSVIKFFKEKIFKPKEIKLPENEEKPKLDTDLVPNEEKIDYGELKKAEQKVETATPTIHENNEEENIFGGSEFEDDDDEIDLDKIFEDLRQEQAKKGDKRFKSEMLEEVEPNFDSMSMEELDSLLEDNLSKGNVPNDLESYFSSNNSNLSGEELGKAIKNLPPQLKMIILNDIFKKKF